MEEVNGKLDKIISILEEKKKPKDEIEDEVVEFMMKNFNISWLDDKIEESAYRVILDFILDKVI